MKKQGFTLLELLMVIFLMGLIILIPLLRFDFLGSKKEEIELKTMVENFNSGRNLAVNTGVNTIIYLNKNGYIIRNNDIEYEYKLDYIKILSHNNENRKITFKTTGAPDLARSILVEGKNKSYKITIEIATGKVNLYEN